MPACKILIIDDDDDLRESLIALLADAGYDARGAGSAVAALAGMSWGEGAPDAILLDLVMPAMDGEQFHVAVQQDPRWSGIPILLCTGDRVPAGLLAGVFGVLRKPFDLDELFALIKRACAGVDGE
jgi:twitching motility two-component system response regulator PilH